MFPVFSGAIGSIPIKNLTSCHCDTSHRANPGPLLRFSGVGVGKVLQFSRGNGALFQDSAANISEQMDLKWLLNSYPMDPVVPS
jgi:hypothetical protein